MSHIRKILRIAAIGLIIFSLGTMAVHYYNRRTAEKKYEEIAESAFTETEEETEGAEPETEEETEPEYISPVNFEELMKINPDTVGWIQIPGTKIDYPVVFDKDDNEKYLHTDFEGNESVSGSIYLDCDDESDFSCQHNILYGHHMKDGTMFKDIVKFRDEEFFSSHQDIMLYLPDREIRLIPMACLYTEGEGIRRKTEFSSITEFQNYVEQMTADAVVYKEPEYPVKKLYSLVTCSYEFEDARTILYCYEADEEAADK